MLTTLLQTVILAALNTAVFLATTLLPIVGLCVVLLVLGRFMNRRLMNSFGFRGVYALAWLGTPVHELSHAIACLVGRHKIEAFKPFKPDEKSGTLGYIQHSFRSDSFYQRVIGNTLIAIAPFFGGSAVIYLLTRLLYPDLLPGAEQLAGHGLHQLGAWSDLYDYVQMWVLALKNFWISIAEPTKYGTWIFWIYLFSMVSVAAHLSPSKSDFHGFWWPVAVILALVFLVHLGLAFWSMDLLTHVGGVQRYLASLNAILIISLFFLISGAALIWLLTAAVGLFQRR